MTDKKCQICNKKFYSKNYCRKHYEQDLRKRNPEFYERQKKNCRNWRNNNIEYAREQNKKYSKNLPKYIKRRNSIKSLYNLSVQEYIELLNNQYNRCYLCNRDIKLHIDHNHTTKQVRKLLCHRCNLCLGWLKEDVNLMRKMIKYVNEY